MDRGDIAPRLNDQIGAELAAAIQCLVLAAYFERRDRGALARLCYEQADARRRGALTLIGHLVDLDEDVRLGSIPAPRCDFPSLDAAVQFAIDLELRSAEAVGRLERLVAGHREPAASDSPADPPRAP